MYKLFAVIIVLICALLLFDQASELEYRGELGEEDYVRQSGDFLLVHRIKNGNFESIEQYNKEQELVKQYSVNQLEEEIGSLSIPAQVVEVVDYEITNKMFIKFEDSEGLIHTYPLIAHPRGLMLESFLIDRKDKKES